MTLLDLALTRAVKARALELGFDAVAVGPATPEHAPAFERWLDAGFGASMTYLERTREACDALMVSDAGAHRRSVLDAREARD